MKFLVLLRHGIAEDKGGGKPDADRELTKEGRERIEESAPRLKKIFPDAEAIYSSPLIRAMQTAEPVAKAYGFKIKTAQALAPQGTIDDVRKLIKEAGDFAIFVGHEPNLSAIALALTKINGDIELKKGGCYGINFEDGTRLEWMLPPRVLRLR